MNDSLERTGIGEHLVQNQTSLVAQYVFDSLKKTILRACDVNQTSLVTPYV